MNILNYHQNNNIELDKVIKVRSTCYVPTRAMKTLILLYDQQGYVTLFYGTIQHSSHWTPQSSVAAFTIMY